ncbi:TonB-dependent receptor [Luminiphilus sp.]|nr:TonB-dependent receptor [Luminiphilus sp.]
MIKSLSRGPGFALAALTVAVATASPAVSAQDALEEVIVTGSRIPVDANSISSVPVQSVTEEDIRNSGEINIADIVADIPALVSSLTAENSTTGSNSLNLRGLGSDRSLTLVNGRRHVSGFRGSQAVDVGTIPRALVKSVQVTTGGASAVYGADAVTGVVNFILKDDFEGFQIDVSAGRPEAGAGQTSVVDVAWGKNFNNGRGNVVLTLTSENDQGITIGDRSWSRDNGIDETLANPDPNGPARAVVQDPRFWLTSQEGSVAPGFGGRGDTYIDLNNNGIADCQESEGGRVGYLAGCWITGSDGTVRVNQDGTVIDGLWGTGGDGGRVSFNRDSLYPKTDRQVVNFNVNYEFSDTLTGFLETKYVRAETMTFTEQDTFYDTLAILPDNAFLPAELQPVMDQVGYLLLTQDPLDFSENNPEKYTRETTRFVAGLEWQPVDGHSIEFSVNQGVFNQKSQTSAIYLDRLYASIDAVLDANGNAVCRSDLDPSAFYEIDYFAGSNGYADGAYASNAYYSFTPGSGQCAPLNPFGTYSASAEAQDFVTASLTDELEIEQFVVNVTAVGSFDVLDSVLDGPLGYAVGVEYRDESSDNKLDPITLGVLPATSSFQPGQLVSDVSPWLNSYTSFDNTQQFNTKGDYDVTDVFAEVRLPIFVDRPLARELTVDGAVRQADYSTLGQATTWKFGLTWAPDDDIRFRATVSEAVRAPNISELFDPRLPIFIAATSDPCASTNVNNGTAVREANCVAALSASGVSQDAIFTDGAYDWTNPLTARFNGVSGGNPNLSEEVADTETFGVVLTPSNIDGLTLSVDYWDVAIEDAISAVSADDILKGCYDSGNYPNLGFCNSFTRRADGGLNFLETGQINFAKLEAEGVDISAAYEFAMGDNNFRVRAVASRQTHLNRFFNPLDESDIDPELKEIQRPKVAGSLNISWDRGPFALSVQTVYQSKQGVDEIEEVLGLYGNQAVYGDAGFFESVMITDINGNYQWSDELSIFAAINNVDDEVPYSTQTAWPVGPRGRTLVLGFSYSM